MRIAIKSPKDFTSGLLFVGFGAVGLLEARNYRLGSLFQMGPAYFPLVLSVVLSLLGLAIVLRALCVVGPPLPRFGWRAPALLTLAFLCFGLSMETLALGFSVAVLAVVVLSAAADRQSRLRELLLLAPLLTAFAAILFIFGLGLPYPLFWAH